jgi:hypothetical protein
MCNELKLKFIPIGEGSYDCTAPYKVELNRDCTFREFVDSVLTRNEWGKISLGPFAYPYFEYRNDGIVYGSVRGDFFDEDYDRKVVSVHARGGWSRMDYTVTLN